MPVIITRFHIQASPTRCFDLARSIDLHQVSTQQTKEKAIGGVTSGLIEPGQSVTWRARHFGIWQTLTSKITEFDPPYRFVDEMVEGAFVHFRHEHKFEAVEGGTLMTDTFAYSVPYGILGSLFDWLILKRYMKRFLTRRNEVIKVQAEKSTEY
ncbi:MAG: hypothetical protein Roseis2KO_29460 [Roseivirga sp.]